MALCEIVNLRGELIGHMDFGGDEDRHAALWSGPAPGPQRADGLLHTARLALAGDVTASERLDDARAKQAAAELWEADPGVRAEFLDVADLSFALRHPTPQAVADAVDLRRFVR